MVAVRESSWARYWLFWRSSLYTNSVLLLVAQGSGSALGFLFWAVAARFYSPEEVGLGAAAIAAMSLLSLFSMLGLNYGLIRFLPHAADPEDTINSSLTVGVGVALALSLAFVVGSRVWSPALLTLWANPFLVAGFVVTTLATTTMALLGSIFIARMRASLVCAQSVLFGTMRLIFAVVLAWAAHPVGLLGAWTLAVVVTVLCGIGLFLPRTEEGRYAPRVTVRRRALQDMVAFAGENYASAVLWEAPMLLLPLLIVNVVGPKASAHFYVASSVSGLLWMIPMAFSISLFAHGSHDEEQLGKRTIESMRGALGLLLPAIGMIVLFGGKVLRIYGTSYSEQGTGLLWILALSTLPMTINFLFFSVRRIQQRMHEVIAATVWSLVATLGLSAILLPRMGLLGPGIAWFTAQATVALVAIVLYLRRES